MKSNQTVFRKLFRTPHHVLTMKTLMDNYLSENKKLYFCFKNNIWQKLPSRGVPRKRCSENMQQIYRRIPMPKCDFNKVALQWRDSIWHEALFKKLCYGS